MYNQLLNDCRNSIENQDFDYGFRKLLDAVITTKQHKFYDNAFSIADDYIKNWDGKFTEKSFKLLDDLQEYSTNHNLDSNKNEHFIKTKKLSKTYGFGKFTLGEINLKVEQGQLIGLVGENGNGKTTLLRILAKDLSYSEGEIDSNFEKDSMYDQRTRLIYVPQRTPKRYGKVKEHLKFVASHYGIKGKANEYEVLMSIARMGLWKYKSLKWSELSSGYKMRFELARVLLRNPRILLLDEPLANLDVLAQQVVLEDLKSLTTSMQPMAVILSSQQLYELEKVSDKIVFLKNGVPDDQLNLNESEYNLIIELEANISREDLQTQLNPDKMEYNGGYFVLFYKEQSMEILLNLLLSHNISIKYLRDITQSSRRFFV